MVPEPRGRALTARRSELRGCTERLRRKEPVRADSAVDDASELRAARCRCAVSTRMPLLLLLHLLQLARQPDVVAAPSPAQSTHYPWDAASGPGNHTRAAAAPTPADADEASSPWSAARRLLADVVGVGDPKCPAGSSPCPVHKDRCCTSEGVAVPQETLPPNCWLHTAGCFDDCSTRQACTKTTVRTLPIGVGGCCVAGQDLNGLCPGACGTKMCVNEATKDYKEQCPSASDIKMCPDCDRSKLSQEYCANMCLLISDGKYRYSGVEWGSQCFCGNTLSEISKEVDIGECAKGCDPKSAHPDCSCPGKPDEKCGGGMTMMVTEIVCGAQWGLTIVVLLGVVGSGYVVGGMALAKHTGATGRGLQLHPHYARWEELHGLCLDGVRFVRGGRRAGGGYAAVAESDAAPPGGGGRRERGKGGREDEGGKAKREEKRRGGKGSKEKKEKKEKRGKAAKRDGTDSAAAMTEEAEETAAEEKERMLQEQRSKGVHSSQQKIKVVGLSSS